LRLPKATRGKLLIDVTAPLESGEQEENQARAGGIGGASGAVEVGTERARGAAFQNISYTHLTDLHDELGCDVLVCGNDKEAKKQVIELAKAAGMAAFDAGPIENAVVAKG